MLLHYDIIISVIITVYMKYFFVMLCIFVLSGCGASAPEVVNEPPEVKDAGVVDAEASASEEEEEPATATSTENVVPGYTRHSGVTYTKRITREETKFKGDTKLALEVMKEAKEKGIDENLSVSPNGMMQYSNAEHDISFSYPPEYGAIVEGGNYVWDTGISFGIGFEGLGYGLVMYSDDYRVGVGNYIPIWAGEHIEPGTPLHTVRDFIKSKKTPIKNLERLKLGDGEVLKYDSYVEYVEKLDEIHYIIPDIDSDVLDYGGAILHHDELHMEEDLEEMLTHVLGK